MMKLKSEHLWAALQDDRGNDHIPVPRFVAMALLDDLCTLRDALTDSEQADARTWDALSDEALARTESEVDDD